MVRHREKLLLILIPLVSWVATCNAHDANTAFLDCVSKYSEGVRERIYAPDSQLYNVRLENATKNPTWFNLTTQRPAYIAVPTEPEEIRPVILCGKELGFQVRPKSGGHDYEGLSFRSETPFVMVDLSNLKKIVVDVQEETASIQTGVTLGELYYAIGNKSKTLAFPGGLYCSVGSGGHISGGGLGTLLRKYGLAADNVIDAEVMDVNGKILDRKSMGEDLFWAIRGGGGSSFGVILSWKLKLVRVPEKVTYFSFRRELTPETSDIFQKWQNTASKLPQDVFLRVLLNPQKVLNNTRTIVKSLYQGLFLGTADELVPLINTYYPEFGLEIEDCFPETAKNERDKNDLISKECGEGSWIQSVFYFMQSMNRINSPPTELLALSIAKSDFTKYQKATSDFLQTPIPDEGVKMILDMLLSSNSQSMVILDPFGGRMDEIAETDSPFPHRKGNMFSVQYMNNWPAADDASRYVSWIREMLVKMEPYVSLSPRGAYINYKDLGLGKNDQNCSYDQAKVWGEKYFKGNFEKLARVKGMVDPENFFKNEQSIPVLL